MANVHAHKSATLSPDLRPLILVFFLAIMIFRGDVLRFINLWLSAGSNAGEASSIHDNMTISSSASPDLAPFYFQPIAINSAGTELLMIVNGIGPVLAKDIVAFREQYGPFRNAEDLMKIRGIGERRAQQLGNELRFNLSDARKE